MGKYDLITMNLLNEIKELEQKQNELEKKRQILSNKCDGIKNNINSNYKFLIEVESTKNKVLYCKQKCLLNKIILLSIIFISSISLITIYYTLSLPVIILLGIQLLVMSLSIERYLNKTKKERKMIANNKKMKNMIKY